MSSERVSETAVQLTTGECNDPMGHRVAMIVIPVIFAFGLAVWIVPQVYPHYEIYVAPSGRIDNPVPLSARTLEWRPAVFWNSVISQCVIGFCFGVSFGVGVGSTSGAFRFALAGLVSGAVFGAGGGVVGGAVGSSCLTGSSLGEAPLQVVMIGQMVAWSLTGAGLGFGIGSLRRLRCGLRMAIALGFGGVLVGMLYCPASLILFNSNVDQEFVITPTGSRDLCLCLGIAACVSGSIIGLFSIRDTSRQADAMSVADPESFESV